MYHYTDCGLDNIWLRNGYKMVKTPYGKGVSIEDADALHSLIAQNLTQKPGKISGKEFRYLRTILELSQQSFAKMVGLTEQSVSLWERHGKVPTAADATIRMLVIEKFEGNAKITDVLKRINTVDRLINQQIIASEKGSKWIAKTQARKPELSGI